MCQYSAVDGSMTDWHTMHLGQFAMSGAGLTMVAATRVRPEGRITHGCTGLYSDDNERAMAAGLKRFRRSSPNPIAVPLAHAGRRAWAQPPSLGGKALAA